MTHRPLIGAILLLTAGLAGCLSHPPSTQSTDPWHEPGIWEASEALLEDPDLEIQVSGASSGLQEGPVPWDGLEHASLWRLTLFGSGEAGSFALFIADGSTDASALRVCLTDPPLPVDVATWAQAWPVIDAQTNGTVDEAPLRAYFVETPQDGGFVYRCVDTNGTVTLDGLDLVSVDRRQPGLYTAQGPGFQADMRLPSRTVILQAPPLTDEQGQPIDASWERFTQISWDIEDLVEVRRKFDPDESHRLEGEELQRFVTDRFLEAGLPAPADPSKIRWTQYER